MQAEMDAATQYRLGVEAGRRGQPRAGLLHLKAAIELDGQRRDYWLSYCEALVACRENATALAVIHGARQHGLDSPDMENLEKQIRDADRPEWEDLYRVALEHHSNNSLADAVESYRKVLALKPDFTEAHYNLGLALEKSDRPQEAIDAYRAAIDARPDFAEAFVNMGVLLFATGALDDAIAAYDAAIMAHPAFLAAHHNRGTALRQKGALGDAALAYETAIAIEPRFAEAHHHLGNLLRERGEVDAAVRRYRIALDIKPDFPEAVHDLGYALVETGQIREGFSCLTRYAELACRGMADPGPLHKQRHDEEQRAFLGPGKSDPLAALRIDGGTRLSTSTLNSNSDILSVERQWRESTPQLVVIDDFLSEEALRALRHFCWNSTIWRESYAKGYLGAFPEHGVACPLLAQVAEDLRHAYKSIFRDHPLLQLWAFKYESKLGGIPLHADFAAVNVNFWITPDDANCDPDHGGLMVWDKPAPKDWDFDKYNNDPAAGRAFLTAQGARAITIPHRSNRAVIFHSDLFHETDAIDFKDGYCNRRINLTLLYGRRDKG